jgi:transcriptional regulator with XRE-family HTH domain
MRRSGTPSRRKEAPRVNNIVATNIRILREAKPWTQAQLAEAADIAERTVQRAEEGKGLSAETLQAVAGALDVPVDELRFDAKKQWADIFGVRVEEVTPELIAARIAAEEEKYWRVPMSRIKSPSDIRLAYEAHAVHFSTRDIDEDAQDVAAELNESLSDLMDLRDVGPQQQRKFLKSAFEIVERLERAGCTTTIGLHHHALRATGGAPIRWATLYVFVTSAEDVPAFALIEKGKPYRLG